MTNVINYSDGTSVNADWKDKQGKYYNKIHLGSDEFTADYCEGVKYKGRFYLDYNGSGCLRYIVVLSLDNKIEHAFLLTQLEVFKLIKAKNIVNIEIV